MFTQDDFKSQAIRLKIIINYKLGLNIFSEFKDMSRLKQKEFNIKLNEYIKALPDDWEETVMNDFNEICADQIFHKFEPEKMHVPLGGSIRLLTEEQQRLAEEEKWILPPL
jgi:hypothetical protein